MAQTTRSVENGVAQGIRSRLGRCYRPTSFHTTKCSVRQCPDWRIWRSALAYRKRSSQPQTGIDHAEKHEAAKCQRLCDAEAIWIKKRAEKLQPTHSGAAPHREDQNFIGTATRNGVVHVGSGSTTSIRSAVATISRKSLTSRASWVPGHGGCRKPGLQMPRSAALARVTFGCTPAPRHQRPTE